jgi:hypothetical protein
MKSTFPISLGPVIALCAFALPALHADWQRTDTTIAWRAGDQVVWRFSFDPQKGKTFFHPLAPVGGPALTNFQPEDHPWHYGLWFSWKYINGVNYWEEDRQTGKPEGATRWSTPQIETRTDGSATIRLDVTYTHPSGRVDMTEKRQLDISAPSADGLYTIDWRADFTAGQAGAKLDRTPMPGEPDGKVNGGYAGLGARLASAPLVMSVVTTDAAVTTFTTDRARPAVPAVGCNFTDGGKQVGGIAFLSDPANIGERAPWYLINGKVMRFACAAILAPEVRTLAPGGVWKLRYRIEVQPGAWTPETLRTAMTAWQK